MKSAILPSAVRGALLLVLATGCDDGPAGASEAAVTGTVTYLERIAMPQGAVVIVRLEDVSLADASSVRLGEQVITSPGNVPVPYRVEYDSGAIDSRNRYAVRAEIRVDGRLWATTTRAYSVITRGNPTSDVEIVVERVSS
jgi:putative lipoprotein